MASPDDHKHIATVLIPQLLSRFNDWGREYQQPRDLGVRGEFVGLYRKARKLKTLLWDRRDGDPPPEQAGWREGPREIMMEVVAHGLLMLVDWDNDHPEEAPAALGDEKSNPLAEALKDYGMSLKDMDADAPNYQADSEEEEGEEDYCPTCASHMKASRLVISHGTKCGDKWHQADRIGGV